jgi:outer membrane protein TolC
MLDTLRHFARARTAPVLAAALLATSGAFAQEAALGADLGPLLEYARSANPELAAMQREAEAAAQRVGPAGALPDPVLRVELENINNYGNSASPSLLPSRVGDTKYTLMQQLPAWGKRDLRRSGAEADAESARARDTATWAEQAARIKTAYAQYFLAARTERITNEQLDLMTRLQRVAQVRYAGGLVPQQDAIRAQLELTAMRTDLVGVASEKRQLRSRINVLLARDPSAPLAEPLALAPASPLPPAAELTERARAMNLSVRTEQAKLRSAQANRDLALRNRYPDFNVGISPMQVGSRLTAWSVMVEFNIPLQQATRRSQEREASAMVEAGRDRVQAAANQAAADLEEQLSGLEAARRNEALAAGEQLPQSELILKSAVAAYENGKIDFSTLLDAQHQIRKARIDLLKAQVDAAMREAEIARILGEAP